MRELAMLAVSVAFLTAISADGALAARALILNEPFPSSSQAFCSRLRASVASAGFEVEEVGGEALAAGLDGEDGPGSILVLPNASCFPAVAKRSLVEFLKRGNHLMAVSGPAFETMVVKVGGAWITKQQAKAELAHRPGTTVVDFADEDLSEWQRSSGTMTNPTSYRVEPSGDPDVPAALHADYGRLDNWDTILSRPLQNPFPQGTTVTTFWAKGGPDTPEMVVEWRERDGSRWMAVVKLSAKWQRYALAPEDFRFWTHGSPSTRGDAGDRFNPANAQSIAFGLAAGLSTQKLGIAHSLWVADVRAVADEFASVDFAPPLLECISPQYKTYGTLAANALLVPSGESLPARTKVLSAIPRRKGFACEAARKSRFIPVVRATDAAGEPRGTAAHLYLNTGNEFAGSVWGFVGYDQDFLERNADKLVPVIVSMLERMRSGVFLANAGTEFFAYEEGESAKTGAYVVNLRPEPVNAKLSFVISAEGRFVGTSTVDVTAKPFRDKGVPKQPEVIPGDAIELPAGGYLIRTSLSVDGKTADEIAHEFRVVSYPPLSPRNTVSVEGGEFCLDGKPWHALGMNYWPRYACGAEPADFWAHWLSPEFYDPELIEQDLALAQKLKMNVLSVQYHNPHQARPLMDFLARCDRRGIKAHVFLPGLDPLRPDLKIANELIRLARLPRDPAMFAYDVAWEVRAGEYKHRKAFDRQWQQWVIDQYGSVEAAEADWHYKPERVDGVLTGPQDEQLIKDGEWRIFVAAYRRFWDDEISKRYRQIRANVRRLDKLHPIGARSGYGGTGSMGIAPRFPFDLASGAKHLDYISPEGYGLRRGKPGFLRGGFTTLYGKFVSGGKPVFWVEYGHSIWPACDAETMWQQREVYEAMFGMVRESGANGSAGWWWPGGLRRDENSDFGIVNPDGTPRPAALEFPKLAEKIKTAGSNSEADCVFTIDRDDHIAGYAGLLAQYGDDYAKAIESGSTPAMRTDATGKTSADVPLVAVGGVAYTGSNPPKFLNAEFNWIKINGRVVRPGDVVEVKRGKPVYVEASVGNTAEAKWLAPNGDEAAGTVGLLVTSGDERRVVAWAPISKDTPFLADAWVPPFKLADTVEQDTTYTFRMQAAGRASFGEVVRLTLKPAESETNSP